jgi:hypothetical protein
MQTKTSETIQSRKGMLSNKEEPGKLLIYEALFTLNREFGQVLDTLDRLEQLRLFRPPRRREIIRACRVSVGETRAWANVELMEILLPVEEEDWSRFGRLRRQLERSNDILVNARAPGKKNRSQNGKSPGGHRS